MERSSTELLASLRALQQELAVDMRRQFERDLPFEELAFDRWERARQLGFGEGASIYRSSYVLKDVRVGRSTWIGPFVMLDGTGGIEIGEFCSISSGVHIYTHDTIRWALSGGKQEREVGAVRIGDCSYVGSQSIVLKGVEIGDHCVIGANSVVTRPVPPYSVAFGSPAEVRGEVVMAPGGEIELVMSRS